MIELQGTTKTFGDFTALDRVDLKIPNGAAYGLLGSNGAGKSTILRLLSGIYKPEGGRVLIDGEDVFDNVAVKQKVFFINDETIQFSSMTLKELKNFYRQFYPNFSDAIFEKLEGAIKLPMDKKLSAFSKGMKRQAIIITGLACCTPYLLLDEAVDGVDPTMRIILKRMLIDAMCERGMTAVISSHNLSEINEMCDSAALLHQGHIIFDRQLDSLKGSVHKLQLAIADRSRVLTREDLPGLDILHFAQTQSIYHIIARGTEEALREAIAPLHPVVADIVPLTLEEIFIYELEVSGYESNVLSD